jgi:hypothetical protein
MAQSSLARITDWLAGYLKYQAPGSNKNKQNGKRRGKKKGRKKKVQRDVAQLSRIANRISGRGDYKTWLGHLKKASKGMAPILGGALGGQAANYFGGSRAVGSRIGRNLGMKFSQVTGWGDYEIMENTLLRPHPVPEFGLSSIRVTHKEYLGNVLGSEQFASTVYRLNPGISDSFPWLAGIARNYQQFRFNGMLFEFVSTSAFALNSTNSALGKVILATNYNAEDDPFTSTVAMLSTQFSNYGRPAESMTHAIECAPSETPTDLLYIRTDVEEKGRDLRFTDLGFTQISTEGMQSGAEIGGLWVTYDVTFTKPIINTDINLDIGVDQFIIQANTNQMYAGTITARNNILAGTFSLNGEAGLYAFNEGVSSGKYWIFEEYTIPEELKSGSVSASVIAPLEFSNCKLVVDTDYDGPNNQLYRVGGTVNNGISQVPTVGSNTGTTTALRYYMVEVTGPRPYFTTSNFANNAATCFWRFTVSPVSYNTTPQVYGPPPLNN